MTATARISASCTAAPSASAPDGRTVDGEDHFTPADSRGFDPRRADEYAIRFHLHPSIKANRLSEGRGVILLLPDREVWTFTTQGEPVDVEESVYLAGSDGPRRAVQIVIYGHARDDRDRALELPPHPAGHAGRQARAGRRAGIAAVI